MTLKRITSIRLATIHHAIADCQMHLKLPLLYITRKDQTQALICKRLLHQVMIVSVLPVLVEVVCSSL